MGSNTLISLFIMQIIAHRGYWLDPAEKNTAKAFDRALRNGFGIETDLRDRMGEVVISHDMPYGGEMTLADFLSLCAEYPVARPLALNIKADGLQTLVQAALAEHGIVDAFVFDMAVPDALGYLKAGLPTFTRHSEYELAPAFLNRCQGIWMDAFHGNDYDLALARNWLQAGLQVCMVSPELHRRPHAETWAQFRASGLPAMPGFSLCTDFPEDAKEFFDE